jgi:recombinational DNA repair protein RecT
MGQITTLDQKIATLKSVNEVFTLQEVKDRFIRNYESTTGKKDGANRMEQERFAYLQILQDKPDLAKVDKLFHFMALVYAGTTGLSFRDNKLYVIPSGNGKLKVQPSPAGRREMMEMMPNVVEVPEAVLVLKGDKFVHDKLNRSVKIHEASEKVEAKHTLDNIVAVYQPIIYKDKTIFVVVYQDELIKAKNKSKMKDGGPWVDWPGEMAKKTATNRAFRLYHKYPDNVVLYGDIEGDEDTVETPYSEEISDPEPIISQTEGGGTVDESSGEMITPTEEYKHEPKKETKPKSGQTSLMD